jgi:3-deoxy-D-manno-octulosonic-acid transferase
MAVIYFISVKFYSSCIFAASLFNKKASLWVEGRKKWKQQYQAVLKPGEKRILFHCASLGEFEQGKPVLESLKKNYPDFKIVLTFFSPSGYEVKKNEALADYVFYLPMDGPFSARNFISIVNPSMAFFVKYDFWHFYIRELKTRKIPLFFVSSVFRPSQIFFQWYGKFFDLMLRRVTHFFVQNQGSLELLYKNSISQVTVTGDTRVDRVYQNSMRCADFPEIAVFKGEKKLFVAGSTWPEDDKVLSAFYKEIKNEYRIIVAPHEIEEKQITDLAEIAGLKSLRYSQWDKKTTDANILIIDNVGMLSSLYRYADAAFIGGGFNKGIHNILEAAVFGIPVFFGPKYKKFREATELIHWNGAFSVSNEPELKQKFSSIISNPAKLEKIREANLRYVNNNRGATDIIINYLKLNYQF